MFPFLSPLRGKETEGALQLLNLEAYFFSICCRGFMKFLESAKECRPGVLVRQIQTVSFCIRSLLTVRCRKGYTGFGAAEGWPETATAGCLLVGPRKAAAIFSQVSEWDLLWGRFQPHLSRWDLPSCGKRHSVVRLSKGRRERVTTQLLRQQSAGSPVLSELMLGSCWCAAPKGPERTRWTRGSPSGVAKHH